jgi:hypothetical protein
MKTYKSIAFGYPSSPSAKKLGFNDSGCFYVVQRVMREDGSWQTGAVHNAEGFLKANDANLIAFYIETHGEICPMFFRHGNQDALTAIQEA